MDESEFDHNRNNEHSDFRILKECIDLFSSMDYIMEPTIFETIKNYFMR